jgi:hypothetical protein
MPKRKCKICGTYLCIHNHEDVCYHHPEHKNYNRLGIPIDYTVESKCSSLPNFGAFIASQDYYGCYRD